VTGLSADGNRLYLGSRNQNRIYYYTLPGIAARQEFTFMTGYSTTCDIAFDGNNDLVWVASENTSLAIKCYDTNNTMVDYISNDMVPNARGMALDPNGYLWVSDIEEDKIYKIDLTEGIEEGDAQGFIITPSSNPFSGAVTIQTPGVEATVTIFDMNGRQIERAAFQESYTWNSSAPSGNYVFVVQSTDGASSTLELLKL